MNCSEQRESEITPQIYLTHSNNSSLSYLYIKAAKSSVPREKLNNFEGVKEDEHNIICATVKTCISVTK